MDPQCKVYQTYYFSFLTCIFSKCLLLVLIINHWSYTSGEGRNCVCVSVCPSVLNLWSGHDAYHIFLIWSGIPDAQTKTSFFKQDSHAMKIDIAQPYIVSFTSGGTL